MRNRRRIHLSRYAKFWLTGVVHRGDEGKGRGKQRDSRVRKPTPWEVMAHYIPKLA